MNAWATTGGRRLKYFLLSVDLVLLVGTGLVAAVIRDLLGGPAANDVIVSAGILPLATVLAVYIGVLYVFSLYNVEVGRAPIRCLIFVVGAVTVALFLIAALLYFLSPGSVLVGRTVLMSHAMLIGATVYGWRLVFVRWLLPQWAERRIGILSSSVEYADWVARLNAADGVQWKIVHVSGTAREGDGRRGSARPAQPEALWGGGAFDGQEAFSTGGVAVHEACQFDIIAAARRYHIDTLVCSLGRETSDGFIRDAMSLRRNGVEVCDFLSFYSSNFGRMPLDVVDAQWILQSIRFRRQPGVERLRRIGDVIASAVLLAIAAPVMIVIAIATRLTSRGPVIFVQERLGLHERPFKCYKFRTMVNNAEATSGPRWADRGDTRITPLGHLLRRTRLDELPQLLNILRGDMSLVGFRPIRRHFADVLGGVIPFYHVRFGIKPGLTGWPQVRHDYAGSLEGQRAKFEYELFYLANRSLLLDCYIVIKTIQVMLFGRGQ